MQHKSKIMYVESKAEGLVGPARIGRVTFTKTGKTLKYQGRSFRSLKGTGYKANYYDINTGEHFWISGPKRNGADSLYATNIRTPIDEDARVEYWTKIRRKPDRINEKHA